MGVWWRSSQVGTGAPVGGEGRGKCRGELHRPLCCLRIAAYSFTDRTPEGGLQLAVPRFFRTLWTGKLKQIDRTNNANAQPRSLPPGAGLRHWPLGSRKLGDTACHQPLCLDDRLSRSSSMRACGMGVYIVGSVTAGSQVRSPISISPRSHADRAMHSAHLQWHQSRYHAFRRLPQRNNPNVSDTKDLCACIYCVPCRIAPAQALLALVAPASLFPYGCSCSTLKEPAWQHFSSSHGAPCECEAVEPPHSRTTLKSTELADMWRCIQYCGDHANLSILLDLPFMMCLRSSQSKEGSEICDMIESPGKGPSMHFCAHSQACSPLR